MLNVSKVNMKLDWKIIDNEASRTYLYPSLIDSPFPRPPVEVTITEPVLLCVNFKSGGHRIIDASGKCWYQPAGWCSLNWVGFDDGVPVYGF